MLWKFFLISLAVGSGVGVEEKPLRWTGGQFQWPNTLVESMFKVWDYYTSGNIIATRAAIVRNRAILALPRLRNGVPATLASIPLNVRTGEPTLFSAYPTWELQLEGNSTALQNVADIFLDPKDVLWVLDTGIIDVLEEPVFISEPKIFSINTITDKVTGNISLAGLATDPTRLEHVIADYNPKGEVFVYVTDSLSNVIIVHDVKAVRSQLLQLPMDTMEDCKSLGELQAILVCPKNGSNSLLLSYSCSPRIFSIDSSSLQNSSLKLVDVGTKPKPIFFLGSDGATKIFLRYGGKTQIYSWDALTPFTPNNFDKDANFDDDYSFATHVVSDVKKHRTRVLSSNFHSFYDETFTGEVEHSLGFL